MKLRKYEKVTKKDWFLTVTVLLIFIVLLSLSSLLLSGFLYFWVLIVLVAIALLVIWHAKNFAYLCPKCGQVFEVSAWEDLLGPNGGSKKYVRCPGCRRQAWAEILKIKE